MNKKGFIFDLDGVIVDTAKYHFLAWKKLANGVGVDFTHVQNEQLKGVSRQKSLEKILEWGDKTLPEDEFNRLMALKNEDYLTHVENMNEDEILPDVPKILNYLISKEQPLALGSASKNAHTILDKVNLLKKFDAIVDGNGVKTGKPNPEVFLNAANMISIGIGDKDVLNEADYVFNDFTEITTEFIQDIIEGTITKQ